VGMEATYLGLLEISKLCITTRVTANVSVCKRPCWLVGLIVEPETIANVTRVYARNGESEQAEILIPYGAQYAQPIHHSVFPVYFNRGLYIDLETNALSCTVQFLEDTT